MLFSKSINTKKDPLVDLQAALATAIEAAVKAKVPPSDIARELKSRGAHFQRAVDSAIEAWGNAALPVMYDQETLQPIDMHSKLARAEEERAARELRQQQEEFRKTVDERGRRDAISRGKVL